MALTNVKRLRSLRQLEDTIALPADAEEDIIALPADAEEDIIALPADAEEDFIALPADANEDIIALSADEDEDSIAPTDAPTCAGMCVDILTNATESVEA